MPARKFEPYFSDAEWQRIYPRLLIRAVQRRQDAATVDGRSPAEILRSCEQSFLAFLPFWKFKVRDNTGRNAPVVTFSNLWRGQRLFAEKMDDRTDPAYPNGPWIFALKAGKLGFTELECAFDAYTALFRGPNTRVHIFSRDGEASKELLKIVRFGLTSLPKFFGVRLAKRTDPGGDNTTSLRLVFGVDDERTIKSYPTGENIAIDQSCHHAHVDELAHMKHGKGLWENVQTTVAQDGGTLHIVTRGAGDDAFIRELWESAEAGHHELRAFFANWTLRDDRDQAWRERESNKNTQAGLQHFAPETAEDALAGDETNSFTTPAAWDACFEPDLAPLVPGRRGTPLVVAADAGISHDYFAITAASRHPVRHNDPAIRAVKVFQPDQFPEGRIDFAVVEGWLRVLCRGGCPGDPAARIEPHPRYPESPSVPRVWTNRPECASCRAGVTIEPYNVFKVVYDAYQLEDMMQRFRREGVVTVQAFGQTRDRMIADRGLLDTILSRRLAHNGDPVLREHALNANAKLQKGEDSKLRLVKKDDHRRIDAIVSASMSVDEVLRLWL